MTEVLRDHELDFAPFGAKIREAYEKLDGSFSQPDYQAIELRGIPTKSDERQTINVWTALNGPTMHEGAKITIVPAIIGFPTLSFTKDPGFDLWTEHNSQRNDELAVPVTLDTKNVAQFTQNLLQVNPDDPSFTILNSSATDDALLYEGLVDAYYDRAPQKKRITSFIHADEFLRPDGSAVYSDETTIGATDIDGVRSHFLAAEIPFTIETGLSSEDEEITSDGRRPVSLATRHAPITVRMEVLKDGTTSLEAFVIDPQFGTITPIEIHDKLSVLEYLETSLATLVESKRNSSGFDFEDFSRL